MKNKILSFLLAVFILVSSSLFYPRYSSTYAEETPRILINLFYGNINNGKVILHWNGELKTIIERKYKDKMVSNRIDVGSQNTFSETVETDIITEFFGDNSYFSFIYNSNNKSMVAIIILQKDYEKLRPWLFSWMKDIFGEGYNVIIQTFDEGASPSSIKDYLKTVNNLKGIELVGNLPIAYIKIKNPWKKDKFMILPTNLFYQNLSGNWVDSDKDGVYDEVEGYSYPDIWCGTLRTGFFNNENNLISLKKYFERLHLYRKNILVVPDRALEYFDISTRAEGWSAFKYFFDNVEVINDPQTTREDYLSRLSTKNYGFVYSESYGSPTAQVMMSVDQRTHQGNVTSLDIKEINPRLLFINLESSLTAKFSVNNFLAGAYTFSKYPLLSIGWSTEIRGEKWEYYAKFFDLAFSHIPFSEIQMYLLTNYSFISEYPNNFYGYTYVGDPLVYIKNPADDKDEDFISDSWEAKNGFNPQKIDSNGDGVSDFDELVNGKGKVLDNIPSYVFNIPKEDSVDYPIIITSLEDSTGIHTGTVTITGTAIDKKTGIDTLTINGNRVSISPNGSFSCTVSFKEGTNTIIIVVTDKVGNETTKILTVICCNGECKANVMEKPYKVNGDTNEDLIINEDDLNNLTSSFGASKKDPNYDPDCDFNNDGIVDGRDLLILMLNFGKNYRLYDFDNDGINNWTELLLKEFGYSISIPITLKNNLEKTKKEHKYFYSAIFNDNIKGDMNAKLLSFYEILSSFRSNFNDLRINIGPQESNKDYILEYTSHKLTEEEYVKMFSQGEIQKLVKINEDFYKNYNFEELKANVLLSQINKNIAPDFIEKMYAIVGSFDNNDNLIFNAFINQPSERDTDGADVLYELFLKNPDLFDKIPRTILANMVEVSQLVGSKGMKIEVMKPPYNYVNFYPVIKNNITVSEAANILSEYFSGIVERMKILEKHKRIYKSYFGYDPSDLDKFKLSVLMFLNPNPRELSISISMMRNEDKNITMMDIFKQSYEIADKQKKVLELLLSHNLINPFDLDKFMWKHKGTHGFDTIRLSSKLLDYIISFFDGNKIPANCLVESALMREVLNALNVPVLRMGVNRTKDEKHSIYGGHAWVNFWNGSYFKTTQIAATKLFNGDKRVYEISLPIMPIDKDGNVVNAEMIIIYPRESAQFKDSSVYKDAVNANGGSVYPDLIMLFLKTNNPSTPIRSLTQLVKSGDILIGSQLS